MTFVWAFLAGGLTLINPCVLPLVPIVAASALQASVLGPLALALGMVVSFTVLGVGLTAFGHLLGLNEELIRTGAATLMAAFGLLLLLPGGERVMHRLTHPVASRAGRRMDGLEATGARSQLAAGILLGGVWSPCVGPTLGGAIGLAASGEGLLEAGLVMLAFGLGLSAVLLGLAYASREVLARRLARLRAWMPWARPFMGFSLIVVGAAVLLRLDQRLEGWLLDLMPVWLQDLSIAL